jgi:fermentation-respiration switch protein FrsA (DUF1100 family)
VKSGLRRLLLAVVILGVLAYVAAAIHLVTQETTLIFQPADARADSRPAFPYEEIDLARQDRARQFAWIMRQDPGQGKREKGEGTREKGEGKRDNGDLWVLYLHGNASTIASRMNVAHYGRIRALGLNLFAPEYRGYNGLDGRLSELSLNVDARAAYDHLRTYGRVPADRIVIFGWSLGAAVAVDLASQVSARAVILEGAPASIVELGQQRYPFFPIRWLIRNRFEPIRKVAGIRAPMLFLHSPDDQVIPIEQGRKLFDAAPSPKTFVEVRGGHIEASEIDADRFYGTIREFLVKIGTGERD